MKNKKNLPPLSLRKKGRRNSIFHSLNHPSISTFPLYLPFNFVLILIFMYVSSPPMHISLLSFSLCVIIKAFLKLVPFFAQSPPLSIVLHVCFWFVFHRFQFILSIFFFVACLFGSIWNFHSCKWCIILEAFVKIVAKRFLDCYSKRIFRRSSNNSSYACNRKSTNFSGEKCIVN